MNESFDTSLDELAASQGLTYPLPSPARARLTTPLAQRSPNIRRKQLNFDVTPALLRGLSPSKSMVLDPGGYGGTSPWQIKVTVQAEPRDGSAAAQTRVTRVPLRDADSSPIKSPSKPRKVAKRKSDVDSAIKKRKGTPMRRRSARISAEQVGLAAKKDEEISALEEPPAKKRRGRPRKSALPAEVEVPRAVEEDFVHDGDFDHVEQGQEFEERNGEDEAEDLDQGRQDGGGSSEEVEGFPELLDYDDDNELPANDFYDHNSSVARKVLYEKDFGPVSDIPSDGEDNEADLQDQYQQDFGPTSDPPSVGNNNEANSRAQYQEDFGPVSDTPSEDDDRQVEEEVDQPADEDYEYVEAPDAQADYEEDAGPEINALSDDESDEPETSPVKPMHKPAGPFDFTKLTPLHVKHTIVEPAQHKPSPRVEVTPVVRPQLRKSDGPTAFGSQLVFSPLPKRMAPKSRSSMRLDDSYLIMGRPARPSDEEMWRTMIKKRPDTPPRTETSAEKESVDPESDTSSDDMELIEEKDFTTRTMGEATMMQSEDFSMVSLSSLPSAKDVNSSLLGRSGLESNLGRLVASYQRPSKLNETLQFSSSPQRSSRRSSRVLERENDEDESSEELESSPQRSSRRSSRMQEQEYEEDERSEGLDSSPQQSFRRNSRTQEQVQQEDVRSEKFQDVSSSPPRSSRRSSRVHDQTRDESMDEPGEQSKAFQQEAEEQSEAFQSENDEPISLHPNITPRSTERSITHSNQSHSDANKSKKRSRPSVRFEDEDLISSPAPNHNARREGSAQAETKKSSLSANITNTHNRLQLSNQTPMPDANRLPTPNSSENHAFPSQAHSLHDLPLSDISYPDLSSPYPNVEVSPAKSDEQLTSPPNTPLRMVDRVDNLKEVPRQPSSGVTKRKYRDEPTPPKTIALEKQLRDDQEAVRRQLEIIKGSAILIESDPESSDGEEAQPTPTKDIWQEASQDFEEEEVSHLPSKHRRPRASEQEGAVQERPSKVSRAESRRSPSENIRREPIHPSMHREPPSKVPCTGSRRSPSQEITPKDKPIRSQEGNATLERKKQTAHNIAAIFQKLDPPVAEEVVYRAPTMHPNNRVRSPGGTMRHPYIVPKAMPGDPYPPLPWNQVKHQVNPQARPQVKPQVKSQDKGKGRTPPEMQGKDISMENLSDITGFSDARQLKLEARQARKQPPFSLKQTQTVPTKTMSIDDTTMTESTMSDPMIEAPTTDDPTFEDPTDLSGRPIRPLKKRPSKIRQPVQQPLTKLEPGFLSRLWNTITLNHPYVAPPRPTHPYLADAEIYPLLPMNWAWSITHWEALNTLYQFYKRKPSRFRITRTENAGLMTDGAEEYIDVQFTNWNYRVRLEETHVVLALVFMELLVLPGAGEFEAVYGRKLEWGDNDPTAREGERINFFDVLGHVFGVIAGEMLRDDEDEGRVVRRDLQDFLFKYKGEKEWRRVHG